MGLGYLSGEIPGWYGLISGGLAVAYFFLMVHIIWNHYIVRDVHEFEGIPGYYGFLAVFVLCVTSGVGLMTIIEMATRKFVVDQMFPLGLLTMLLGGGVACLVVMVAYASANYRNFSRDDVVKPLLGIWLFFYLVSLVIWYLMRDGQLREGMNNISHLGIFLIAGIPSFLQFVAVFFAQNIAHYWKDHQCFDE